MPDVLTKSPFLQGLVESTGAAAGYLPVAAAFGAIATQAGMPPWLSVLMSVWVYAGAAQMAGLQALALGQHPLLVAAGMVVVNLRHVPMSLAVGPILRAAGPKGRLLLAQTLTDEAFALDLRWLGGRPTAFFHGIHMACWAAWIGGTAVGVAVGPLIPETWTAFALPALFVALAVDMVRSLAVRHRLWVPVAGVALTVACHLAGALAGLAAMLAVTAMLTVADRWWGLGAACEENGDAA